MLFFIIIVVLILILFIPIPLKFKLHYSKDRYYVKFYNINIISNDGGILKKILDKKEKREKTIKEPKTNNSKPKDNIDVDSKEKKIKFKTTYKNSLC